MQGIRTKAGSPGSLSVGLECCVGKASLPKGLGRVTSAVLASHLILPLMGHRMLAGAEAGNY